MTGELPCSVDPSHGFQTSIMATGFLDDGLPRVSRMCDDCVTDAMASGVFNKKATLAYIMLLTEEVAQAVHKLTKG